MAYCALSQAMYFTWVAELCPHLNGSNGIQMISDFRRDPSRQLATRPRFRTVLLVVFLYIRTTVKGLCPELAVLVQKPSVHCTCIGT